MAIPPTTYLDKEQCGSYEGFDISTQGINFCQKRITPKFPHFCFRLVDIYNMLYNANGKLSPVEFQFPYKDNTFDLVYLSSVFTHMLTKGMEHITSEIVLKSGGKTFITYFLLNNETRKLMMSGVSNF